MERRKKVRIREDNIILKIKVLFFRYFMDIIKKNSIEEKINLKKLPLIPISDLKRDRNVKLFNMKIKDIFSETSIKMNSRINNDYNKKIIEKIYKEGKEIKVIQILELTFKELFIIFRKKLNKKEDEEELKNIAKKIEGLDLLSNNNYPDINNFFDSLKKNNEYEKDPEETEKYINKIKNLCCNYENWFECKIGRIREKSKWLI